MATLIKYSANSKAKGGPGWKISKVGNPYLVKGDLIAVTWPLAGPEAKFDALLSMSLADIQALKDRILCWGWRVRAKGVKPLGGLAGRPEALAQGYVADEASAKAIAEKVLLQLKGRAKRALQGEGRVNG